MIWINADLHRATTLLPGGFARQRVVDGDLVTVAQAGCLEPVGDAPLFGIPIVALVDTAGAYPGIGAEERGQSNAIAESIMRQSRLRVPSVTVVTGEGGSGGALALAAADRVLMLEHAVYSVISPEGCAAILWRDAGEAQKAAAAFKPDAAHCLELGVVDAVIAEPEGGAHTDPDAAAQLLEQGILAAFDEIDTLDPEERRRQRRAKYRVLGVLAST